MNIFAQVPSEAVTTLSESVFGAILVGAVAVMGVAIAMLWRSNNKKDDIILELTRSQLERRDADLSKVLDALNSTKTALASFESALRRSK